MKFTKMHGAGNDYIYINCMDNCIDRPSEFAKFWSDRHFGIGADGLVLILPSAVADFKMDIYNSDGSRAEMCGNAARCVGKYVYDNYLTDKKLLKLETLSGTKELELNVEDDRVKTVRVNMGKPIFDILDIPVSIDVYSMAYVSMGNPHAVLFLENDLKDLDISKIGYEVENNRLFPNRTNVEFVNVVDRTTLRMRVWERGVGETLACGTGACAVLTASFRNGYCKSSATVELKGGKLFVEIVDNNVYMTGEAVKVFDGEIEVYSQL